MFLPLHDRNPIKHIRFAYVNYTLIAVTILVFVVQWSLPEQQFNQTAVLFGLIPGVIDQSVAPPSTWLPSNVTFVTYAFLHADWLHVLTNMLFLWIFGDNIEDALGHVKYLIFYLLCAIAGAWFHGFLAPESDAPLIGASGAVAGIVAAYVILHPSVRIWVLAFGRIPLRIPAWIPLLLWIGLQFVMLIAMPEDMVSWAAHAGGIVAGALLVLVLRRRGVPLFDRAIVTPHDAVVESEAKPPAEPADTHRWGRQQ